MEITLDQHVRLKADTESSWVDARMKRAARSGRIGTVVTVFGTKEPFDKRSFRVEFECRGAKKPLEEIVRFADLEIVAA